jgi:hypothetical protein
MGMFLFHGGEDWPSTPENCIQDSYVDETRFKGKNTYHYLGDILFYNGKQYILRKIDKQFREATLLSINNDMSTEWVKLQFETISELPRLESITQGN